ncbi:hypothetical protein [Aestuariivita boseongensis]|uniref:hypothetical protein n=1 Tax=Aestuariivita boseongensis TaxID=1470562 RepID=UPI0012F933D3|nr:hypothetical protein [Aestuariivita boseongensis]
MKRTFLLIALLVSVMLGSFIWFVATWDPSERPTISERSPLLLFPNTGGDHDNQRQIA